MNLSQLLVSQMVRPRVVHSLPGRVRIHVAALQRLPEGQSRLLETAEAILTAPAAIESARVCSRTGNILLNYDSAAIGEEQILTFLSGIAQSLAAHASTISALSDDELSARTRHWVDMIRASSGSQLECPDVEEVFAHGLA